MKLWRRGKGHKITNIQAKGGRILIGAIEAGLSISSGFWEIEGLVTRKRADCCEGLCSCQRRSAGNIKGGFVKSLIEEKVHL